MSYIDQALERAKVLARQAKSASDYSSPPSPSRGLSAVAEERAGSQGGGMAGRAPHLRAQAEGRRLFMGGLSYQTTEESLTHYLGREWPPEEVRVKFDFEGRSRGFAFVSFPTVAILEAFLARMPHHIDGKTPECRKVSPDGSGDWGGSSGRKVGAGGGGGGGGGGGAGGGGGGGGGAQVQNMGAPHLRAQAEGRRMFFGGLNYDTTDQTLSDYLSEVRIA